MPVRRFVRRNQPDIATNPKTILDLGHVRFSLT